MATLGQFRRDILSTWSKLNPILADGEFVIVRDDTNSYVIGYKTGDGKTRFNDLEYNSNASFLNEFGVGETAGITQKFASDSINLYNVSKLHWNDATDTNKFTLEEAIAITPTAVRKQGLILTFISSVTDRWETYQNTGDPFTTLYRWKNLAEMPEVIQPSRNLEVTDYLYNIFYSPTTGKDTYKPSRLTTDFIQVEKGQIIDYVIYGYTSSIAIAAFDAGKNLHIDKSIITSSLTGEKGRYVVDETIKFLRITRLNNSTGLKQIVSFYKPDYLPLIEDSSKGIRKFYRSDFTVEGVYINLSTGENTASSSWNATDFIPVAEGEYVYHRNLYGSVGGAVVAFYDGAKKVLQTIAGTNSYEAAIVEVPKDALFVRFSCATSMPVLIQLINGNNRNQLLGAGRGEIIVNGFGRFYVSGTWSREGEDLTVTAGGFTQARLDTETYEDDFILSCRVKSTVDANGGFETGIGKTSPTPGYTDRWIMMCKDNTGSYLKSYYRPSGSFAEHTKVRQKLSVDLQLNKWYVLQLVKTTDAKSTLIGKLYDEATGELLASFTTNTAAYAWGYPVAINRTGQARFSGFVMSYPKKKFPLVAVYGDSFVEGDTIRDTKNLRYSALLQSVIGKGDCLLFGHGGATSRSDETRTLFQMEKVNSTYAIVAYGDNDADFDTWYKYVDYIIKMCKITSTVPVFVTVCPRVGQNSAYITKMQSINNWIKSSGYPYIDANEACTTDGLSWKEGYVLTDGVHPSVTGHQAIFDKIKSDCGFLIENGESYAKRIIEEKFADVDYQLKGNDLLTQYLASSFKATPVSINLLDTVDVLKGWAYNGGVWENNPAYISSGKLYMETGYYTIQNVRAYPTNLNVYIAQFDALGNHLGRTIVTYASEDNLELAFKYNKPEGVAYERIVLSVSGTFDASNMQLERGFAASTPVAFQGWLFDKKEQDFISQAVMGYNEYPIGKNYIDEDNLLYGYSLRNGQWVSVNRGVTSNRLFLKDGVTYTVSNLATFSDVISNMYLAYFDKDGNFLKRTAHAMTVDSTGLKGSCTFKASVNDGKTSYVRIVLQSESVAVHYVPNPQLEEGSVATTYEKYAGTKYVLESAGVKSTDNKNVLLTGASFAYSGNEWFSYVCGTLGITGYNKAVSGETMQHTAQKMHDGTLYTQEEFENFDIFLIFHSHNQTVTDTTNLKENYEDYVFPLTDRSAQWDYVLKKYAAECYAARLNENSKWYGTKDGKPYRVVVVTHWHDARTIFNDSIRALQRKWGFTLCELDKRIGFSKNEVHPVTGEQVSILHCDNPSNNTEVIDGVTYGWHPTRDKGAWIQHRMADIIGDTLVTCEAPTVDGDVLEATLKEFETDIVELNSIVGQLWSDVSLELSNAYLDSAGKTVSNNGWRTTQFIDVKPGNILTYTGNTAASSGLVKCICGYDKEYTFVKVILDTGNYNALRVIIPDGVYKIRCSSVATTEMVLRSISSVGGSSVQKSINKNVRWVGHSIWWYDGNVLAGTEEVARGYQTLLGEQFNFKTTSKYCYSGQSLGGLTTDDALSLMNRAGTWTGAAGDIWTLDTITNDFRRNIPIGTIDDYNNATGITTYYGALRAFKDKVVALSGEDAIVISSNSLRRNNSGYTSTSENTEGHTLLDYEKAVMTIAALNGWYFVDQFRMSAITDETLSITTLDGLHLNNFGYKLAVLPWVSAFDILYSKLLRA